MHFGLSPSTHRCNNKFINSLPLLASYVPPSATLTGKEVFFFLWSLRPHLSNKSTKTEVFFFFFLTIYSVTIYFREGEGKERTTDQLLTLCTANPLPEYVPWLEIKPMLQTSLKSQRKEDFTIMFKDKHLLQFLRFLLWSFICLNDLRTLSNHYQSAYCLYNIKLCRTKCCNSKNSCNNKQNAKSNLQTRPETGGNTRGQSH